MPSQDEVIAAIARKTSGLTEILGQISPPELIELAFTWGLKVPEDQAVKSFLDRPMHERISLLRATNDCMKQLSENVSKPFNALARNVVTETDWLITEYESTFETPRTVMRSRSGQGKSGKVSFLEIAKRVTGISTPVFGISWKPLESERDLARRVVRFLEDRRVLFSPLELEVPEFGIRSILEIRRRLTDELEHLPDSSSLRRSFSAMRAACRKFLTRVEDLGIDYEIQRVQGGGEDLTFLTAIGELRGLFGIHLADVCAQFGIDIEEELASILPLPIDSDISSEQE